VTIEPADDATTADPEFCKRVEGLVPIVTDFIRNEWDWRPWMTEPPTIGDGHGVPSAHPPGWIADDNWTVVFEGAYPWAIDFIAATLEAGPARDYLAASNLSVDCQTGYAIAVFRAE
jgi:hypothetical protein